MKIFGFDHLRVPPLPREFNYGLTAVTSEEMLYTAKPKLYAVLQSPRTQSVSVVVFDDTPEGRSALAAQCRVDRLIKLILGHHVQVESGHQLDFVSGQGAHSDYRRSSIT